MTERRAYLTLRDLEWAVLDLADQEVVVVLQGEDVLQIEGNRSEEGDFPPIPDPVAEQSCGPGRPELTRLSTRAHLPQQYRHQVYPPEFADGPQGTRPQLEVGGLRCLC